MGPLPLPPSLPASTSHLQGCHLHLQQLPNELGALHLGALHTHFAGACVQEV